MSRDYDVTYAANRTLMVLRTDLDAGWRRLEKTYDFFRTLSVWYKDWRVRTQLALIVQPATFDDCVASFPDVSLERSDEGVHYSLAQKKLTVQVALTEDLPWRTTPQRRPIIFLERLPLFYSDALAYDLRVWIVFHAPLPSPIPDVRVWSQKFFVPAGQSESNRRRH